MKKLSILLSITALIFLGCNNEKKELKAEYDAFVKKSDSIHMAHNEFEDRHDKMLSEHQKFSEQLASMEVKDSTVMEDLRKFGLMIERHDAIIKSHREIIDAHKNNPPNFDEISTLEFNDKVEEMRDWHDRVMNDHDLMKDEHEKMQVTYRNIKENLNMKMEEEKS
ncbi:hypothetical protein [Winogradskyella ursingii]|uniref:hypothetical protein n=1 Tax=Winogradskyella ursingii TaxID=2686079 RepID=UPI0015CCADF6|nr:hypothetical protein [Winogradskyella ursingii]